jgi:hypothetical protein
MPPLSRNEHVVSRERIQKIHDAAAARGDNSYIDPTTGMLVMTAHYLEGRGFCCGAGCRHCPYPPADQVAAGRPPDAESWQQKG